MTHLMCSGAAVVAFVLSIAFVRIDKQHRLWAKAFLYMGLCSVLISLVMTVLGISFAEFARHNNNPSANFLRSLKFPYATQFGYVIAMLRGFVFLFLAAETLRFQGLLSEKSIKVLRTALGSLIFACLVFLLFRPHPIFTLYYISIGALTAGGILLWVLLRAPQTNPEKRHSLTGVYAFLVFVETGLLGGIRGQVPWIPENSLTLFTLARMLPLVLLVVYWNFRLKRTELA